MRHHEHRVIVIDPPQRVVELTGMSFVRLFLWIPPIITALYLFLTPMPWMKEIGPWGWCVIILGSLWILGAKAHRYARIRPGIWGKVFKTIAAILVIHAVYRHTRDFFHPDPD